MTRQEAMRPFQMLSNNWRFIRFEDDITFELWFSQLEAYPVEEVSEGIRHAIADIDHTPVVAEILSYVKDVREGKRRQRAMEEAQRQESEAVQCHTCNDFGFVNIIFPTGYEAVRPCSCEKARKAFGEAVLKTVQPEMPSWKSDMLFGVSEIPSQYKLVRVSRVPIPTGQTYIDKEGNTVQRKKYGFVPYFPRTGKGKEEVFWQYQKNGRGI